jgi:DNA-binding protein HU-beta
MNQAELVKAIQYECPGETQETIKAFLTFLSTAVARELSKGEGAEVTLPGIGKFSVKQRMARIGRNPKTGAEMEIPAKNKPHFSAAKSLKDAVMSN